MPGSVTPNAFARLEHPLTRLRLFVITGLIVAVTAGVLAVLVPATRARMAADTALAQSEPRPAKMAMQPAPPPPVLRAAAVVPPARPKMYLFGWALLDLKTDKLAGSANMDQVSNTTESMVKAWLAADYLRHLGDKQPSQTTLDEIADMIENSNDVMANKYYGLDGGRNAIAELIKVCGLSETQIGKSWSYTRITPADAARYGKCIADNTAAGPTWTPWLLDTMRNVKGTVQENNASIITRQGGHWGIIDGLPTSLAKDTAIKNGWTYIYADARWHINCLAIHQPDWVLTVEMQFAGSQTTSGLQQGADACASVARQLVYAPPL